MATQPLMALAVAALEADIATIRTPENVSRHAGEIAASRIVDALAAMVPLLPDLARLNRYGLQADEMHAFQDRIAKALDAVRAVVIR